MARLSGRRSDKWVVIGSLCFAGWVALLDKWAPWTSAIPTAQAAALYPGRVDPSWRAARVSHGQPLECPHGVPADAPVGYGLHTAALLACMAGFMYSGLRVPARGR